MLTVSSERAGERRNRLASRGVLVIWSLLSLPAVGAIFLLEEGELIATAAMILLVLLVIVRVPLAVSLALSGGLGLWSIGGVRLVGGTFADVPYTSIANWTYSVLPMFIFMGIMLGESGAVTRVFDFSKNWFNWLPGGLAIGTNGAGALLSAVSGSTVAAVTALGRVTVPEMLKAGYNKRLASGAVLMAGTGGQLIPPSIFLVIYAGVASTPVGPQLMAGMLPGLLLVVVFTILIAGIVVFRPNLAPRHAPGSGGAITWSGRFTSLVRVWPVPVLITVVIGGLYAGVFTATESAAFGALGALMLGFAFVERGRRFAAISKAFLETAVATSAIFLLVIGAAVLNRLLAISGLARSLVDWVVDLDPSRVQFLLLLIVVYLLLGMVMDPLTIMLVTVPLFMPVLGDLGITLIFFGVFVVFLGELAVITPPVGLVTFVLHKVLQDASVNLGQRIGLKDVFVSALWFIPAAVALLVILVLAPGIVEWLPDKMVQ